MARQNCTELVYVLHIFGTTSLVLLALLCEVSPGQSQVVREYCQMEDYTAACAQDHVIIMQYALYGRMRIGRCVKKAYDSLGCEKDVLGQMDFRCSGRRECDFSVTDIHKTVGSPCPGDLTNYLEANYSCLKVISPKDVRCMAGQPVVISQQAGYIAKSVTEDTKLGTKECPWRLSVKPGQKLNITLINFARDLTRSDGTSGGAHTRPKLCYNFVEIREDHMKQSRPIMQCEHGPREVELYISKTNVVDIIIPGTKQQTYFLLKYEAVGCADPVFPRASWHRRYNDRLTVKCNFTDEEWTLRCHGHHWDSKPGNCSVVIPKYQQEVIDNFPYGILIVVSIGVALGVFFGGLLLTIASLYLKRKRNVPEPPAPPGERVYNFPENMKNVDSAPSVPYGPRAAGTLDRGLGEAQLKELAYMEQQYQQYGYHGTDTPEFRGIVVPPGHIYESPKMGRRTHNTPHNT